MKSFNFIIIVLVFICCVFYKTIASSKPQDPNYKSLKSAAIEHVRSVFEEPNQPDYTKPIPPDKLKEDLDFLFKTIEEVHPNMYAYTSKEEFEPMRDELYRQIKRPMSQLEFYKLTAPVVSELKNDHTYMLPFSFGGEDKVFPIVLHWDGENAILADDYSTNAFPLGSIILAFNGKDTIQIIRKFARYHASECENANPQMVESYSFLWSWLWLEYGSTEPLILTIKSVDGKTRDYIVEPITIKEVIQNMERAKAKPGLKATEAAFESYRYISEYDTCLIEIPNLSFHRTAFRKFLKDTFSRIKKDNPSNLIIDIRGNGGGDASLGDALLHYLTNKPFRQFEKARIKISRQAGNLQQLQQKFPDKKLKTGSLVALDGPFEDPKDNPLRFEGRKFLLIDGGVYSSASSLASAVKCFGIATLIGEETGGRTECYGDVLRFQLPNSGLWFEVAYKHYVQACGKADCRGALPDYEVKQKPQDTAKGTDTVLEFTLNLIKSGEAEK